MRIASMSTDKGWVAVLAAGLLATGCGGEELVRQAPEVTVSQPVTRPVRPYVDFTGTTRAVEAVEVRARVGGVLEQQLFSPSEIVTEGDVLFIIEQEQYAAARDEAVALLRSAVADSALKESNLERVQIAIETNAVSRQDLDKAQAERDAASHDTASRPDAGLCGLRDIPAFRFVLLIVSQRALRVRRAARHAWPGCSSSTCSG